MRHSIANSTAAFSAVLTLCGCALSCSRPEPAADIAALVDGREVPYAEFEAYLAANAIAEAPSLDSEVLSGLFDRFVDELLLTRLAADEGIDETVPRAAVARLVAAATEEVESREIEAYYRTNPERFLRPETVRLRQILVEERAVAEQAARELAAGAAFEDVARRLSQGPRADRGGDQGVLSREDLPPEIAGRIFALSTGEISEIIPAEYGFHVFQVSERRPESRISLEVARAQIVEELAESKRGETAGRLLDSAARRYNVRLFARNLPFQYLGKYD